VHVQILATARWPLPALIRRCFNEMRFFVAVIWLSCVVTWRSSSASISSRQAAQSAAAAAPVTTRPLRQSVGRGQYDVIVTFSSLYSRWWAGTDRYMVTRRKADRFKGPFTRALRPATCECTLRLCMVAVFGEVLVATLVWTYILDTAVDTADSCDLRNLP